MVTTTGGIIRLFQGDVIDMRVLRKYINGYSYLVTHVDVFSKYTWAVHIET
jgi:hypothetical protein